MTPLTRRQAVAALMALPLGTRLGAQARPGPRHRVILGEDAGILLAPDGTMQMWLRRPGFDTAPSALGLGHNNAFTSFTLVTVPNMSGVVAAASSFNRTFAVLGDGRLLAWGKNPNGWLGTTTQAQMETLASWSPNESNTPLPQSVRFDAVDVSVGGDHALALARDGSVYAWGGGMDGQLGIGPMPVIQFRTRTPDSMRFMPMPVRVPDLGDVTAIAAGGRHSLALLKDGTVRAWGSNRSGTVGDGTTMKRDRPTMVPGVRNAVAIAASGLSLALLADGTVMSWGGGNDNERAESTARPVVGLKGVKAIAAGWAHGVALTEAGTVWTWGDNAHSQLGRGRRAPDGSSGLVKELTGVQSIAARHETTTAVLATGRIVTWGEVRLFKREDGPAIYAPYPIPLAVDGLENP
jgi:alpha-tubulin suppressor-like RCC1 family protein